MKKILILSAMFLTSCTQVLKHEQSSDAKLDFDAMRSWQKEQPWNRAYRRAALVEHNKHWNSFSLRCAKEIRPSEVDDFFLMAVINKYGEVIDTKVSTRKINPECFITEISKIIYPEPPVENNVLRFRIRNYNSW